ncbi:MAG TPA: hypothetical protein VNZ62_08555 [Capillimicrobium sp.]|nr:hypothetical protein [Capillimicrobium sp.]
MARFERSSRPAAGAPPTPDGRPKITMRLDPDGRYRPVEPAAETPPETSPQTPDAGDRDTGGESR